MGFKFHDQPKKPLFPVTSMYEHENAWKQVEKVILQLDMLHPYLSFFIWIPNVWDSSVQWILLCLKGKQPDLFILWNVQLCKSNWTSIYMQSKLFIHFCVPPQFCQAVIVHSFNLTKGGTFICLPLALALALPKLFCPGIGLNLVIKKWANRGGSAHMRTLFL